MNIWYAGTQLAIDGLIGDSAEGFLPSGQPQVETVLYVRSDWAGHFARGNRSHTIPFTLHLAPEATTGAALLRLSKFFGSLPESGTLVWEESGEIAKCEDAVLGPVQPVYRRGVAVAVSLSFTGGEIVEGTLADAGIDARIAEDGDWRISENGALLILEN